MISALSSLPPVNPVIAQAFSPMGNNPDGDIASSRANNPASAENTPTRPGAETERSEEEQRVIRELQARDREVRDHENAHRAVGGDLVRGGGYEYQIGPDGQRYAIGGDVQIDTSEVPNDPEATARKMDRVISAALAPAEPSSQDLAVAAEARATRNEAVAAARSAENADDDAQSEQPDEENPLTRQYQQIAGFNDNTLLGGMDLARA